MPFRKGFSGNPGGRPKIIGDLRKHAQSFTAEGLRILISIARDKKIPAYSRVAAIREILDRGHGKALQAHELAFFANSKANPNGGEVVIQVGFGRQGDQPAPSTGNPEPLRLTDRRGVDIEVLPPDPSPDWPGRYGR